MVAVRSISSVAPTFKTVGVPCINWEVSLKQILLVEFKISPASPSAAPMIVWVKVVSLFAPKFNTAESERSDKSSPTIKSPVAFIFPSTYSFSVISLYIRRLLLPYIIDWLP